jgi:hypothetical protein
MNLLSELIDALWLKADKLDVAAENAGTVTCTSTSSDPEPAPKVHLMIQFMDGARLQWSMTKDADHGPEWHFRSFLKWYLCREQSRCFRFVAGGHEEDPCVLQQVTVIRRDQIKIVNVVLRKEEAKNV